MGLSSRRALQVGPNNVLREVTEFFREDSSGREYDNVAVPTYESHPEREAYRLIEERQEQLRSSISDALERRESFERSVSERFGGGSGFSIPSEGIDMSRGKTTWTSLEHQIETGQIDMSKVKWRPGYEPSSD